jgi:acyl carrier protein
MEAREIYALWLKRQISGLIGIEQEDVDMSQSLESYGIDSYDVVVLSGLCSEAFGHDVGAVFLSEPPTLDALAVALDRAISEIESHGK